MKIVKAKIFIANAKIHNNLANIDQIYYNNIPVYQFKHCHSFFKNSDILL